MRIGEIWKIKESFIRDVNELKKTILPTNKDIWESRKIKIISIKDDDVVEYIYLDNLKKSKDIQKEYIQKKLKIISFLNK